MKFRPYDQTQTKFVNLNYREILGEDSDVVIINDIIESHHILAGNTAIFDDISILGIEFTPNS